MALPVSYTTGTASVAANGTVVTGTGTGWLLSQIREGDYFWAAGLQVRILSVDSATQLTLAYPWPGAARTNAAYEVQYTPDATRVLASARQLVESLNNGNQTVPTVLYPDGTAATNPSLADVQKALA